MTTYIQQLFTNAKSSLTHALQNAASTGPVSAVLSSIERYKVYLTQTVTTQGQLIATLTSSVEILSPDVATQLTYGPEVVYHRVNKEFGIELLENFAALVGDGMTITTPDGAVLPVSMGEFDHSVIIGDAPVVRRFYRNPSAPVEYQVADCILYNDVCYPVYDVLKALVENDELNNSILTSISDAKNALQDKGASLIAHAQGWLSSKFASVREYGEQLWRAFKRGGVYGAFCFVLQWVKSLVSIQDSDGILEFTDNSQLCPAQFITGILQAVFSAVAATAALIVSIFSKVLGAALAVIVQVTTWAVQAVQYSYDQTRADVLDDEAVLQSSSPYGVGQLTIADFPWAKSLLADGMSVPCLSVPGAYIFIGPGEYNAQGDVTSVRCEAHPTFTDYSKAWQTLFTSATLSIVQHTGYADATVSGLLQTVSTMTASQFADYMAENASVLRFDNEEATGTLSSSDDEVMRTLLAINTWTYAVFMWLAGDTTRTLGDFFNGSTFKLDLVGGSTYAYKVNPSYASSAIPLWGACISGLFDNGNVLVGGADASTSFVAPTWTDMSAIMSTPFTYNLYAISNCCQNGWFYSVIDCSGMRFAVETPKYDASTFWANFIGAVAAIALATAGVVIASIATRKAIQRRQAINQSAVERAWGTFSETGNADDYKAYRKAVKRNNLWANIIGGTKYDYVNYWNGGGDDGVAYSSSTSDLLYSNQQSVDSLESSIRTLIVGPEA